MKNIGNPNQLDAFKDLPQQMPEKDSLGRTREDIEKASKSLKKEILNSIEFKNGKWFIEGMDADIWISADEELNKKGHYLD